MHRYLALFLIVLAAWAQSAAPKFDVVSIKGCRPEIEQGKRGGSNAGEPTPGGLYLNCQSVMGLIRMAYVLFAGAM